MKLSKMPKAAIAAVGLTALFQATPATATVTVLPFPGTETFYTTKDGSGFIPPGGASAIMYTAGDNVDETFTGTGVTSVDSLKVDFTVDDNLNGSDEEVLISINGTTIGSFVVFDTGGGGGISSVAGSIFFAPIVGSGTYDLAMTLNNSVPTGDGSISFLDGGVFVLNGGVRVVGIPEPVTMSLVGAGLVGLVWLRRRKLNVVAR